MKANMGGLDKVIRVLVAIVVSILYFTNAIGGVLGIVLLGFAFIFVLTSMVSFCPLYLPLGINTCSKDE